MDVGSHANGTTQTHDVKPNYWATMIYQHINVHQLKMLNSLGQNFDTLSFNGICKMCSTNTNNKYHFKL